MSQDWLHQAQFHPLKVLKSTQLDSVARIPLGPRCWVRNNGISGNECAYNVNAGSKAFALSCCGYTIHVLRLS